jgi:hypothetical protein
MVSNATTGVFVMNGTSAEGRWTGDRFQWSGRVGQGKTFELRNTRGSIRAIRSEDDLVHVQAHRTGAPGESEVDLVDTGRGVSLSVGDRDGRAGATTSPTDGARVDVRVRVPAGVRFAGSMGDGPIVVERLRSQVRVATITGRITVRTAGFDVHANTIAGDIDLELRARERAEFHGTTIDGTIESEFPLVPCSDGAALVPTAPFLPGPRTESTRPPHIVHACVGTGGCVLSATTVHGDVRLRRC